MKFYIPYLALVFVLACAAGIAIRVAYDINDRYDTFVETSASTTAANREPFIRFGTIVGLNPQTADVILRIHNIATGIETNVQAKVTTDTKLIIENPIIENGAVIGYDNAKPLLLEDLRVGALVQARFKIAKNGILILERLSIGSPFPRF